MKIAVSVESTSDLSQDMLQKYDVKVIRFEIILGDRVFKDGDLSTADMFDFVDKNGVLPKTTALNEYEYTEFFQDILKDYDAVIHVSLSSGLSSSYLHAAQAAKGLENVYVVDSQTLSTGIGLLAIYARELAEQGVAPKEIFDKVQARASKLQVSFVIERLDYLFKGGRCSSLQLLGANLLKLRPRIVLKEGKMGTDKKYRGSMPNVISKYCQEVLADFPNPDLDKVFITRTTATPEMMAAARSACEAAGFNNIYETYAGGTIASHCGANTLGILYFNDGEQ